MGLTGTFILTGSRVFMYIYMEITAKQITAANTQILSVIYLTPKQLIYFELSGKRSDDVTKLNL